MTIDGTLRKALLQPRCIALVGASPDMAKNNSRPQRFLKRFGYSGRVLPINPSRAEVLGERAYPDLKSNTNFLTLQSQIEGTENSILVGRRDYNEAVQAYNTRIRTFPDAIGAKIFYGAKPKVPFEAAAGSQNAPKVDFNTTS